MRAGAVAALTVLAIVWAAFLIDATRALAQSHRPHSHSFRGAPASPPPESPTRPCRTDADCPTLDGFEGRCFTASLAAQYTQAFRDCGDGRTWRAGRQVGTCVYDQCRSESARGGSACPSAMRCGTLEMVPFPQRVCVDASCQNDFDCSRHAAGHCAGFFNAGRCQRGGWACSYAGDECAPRDPHHMCPVRPGMLPYCAPRAGRFVCVQEPVIPPDGGVDAAP